MGKRSWNEGRKASWRGRLALVLALVLAIAGSAGLALPGTVTLASAAESTASEQANNDVTIGVIGQDAKGNSVWFMVPSLAPLSESTNGWDVVKASFEAADLQYDATEGTQYGTLLNSITDPDTGRTLANQNKAPYTSWILYINGKASNTGISSVTLKRGDNVTWVYSSYNADFSAPGVPGNPMYRLYNPNSGEHFYTASTSERNDVVAAGWRSEGVGWTAPAAGDPVYRLYNKNAGEHHYTLSAKERDDLIRAGWSYEGIGWYSDPQHTVPVYREYNPNQFACNHNFTPSKAEHDHLVGLGWHDEGTAWYGVSRTIKSTANE